MNIKDKAKEYAEGKAINALTAAIESAYAEGYNAGFNDGVASKEGEKPDDLEDGVRYVDLGLPSGTKWAADYLKDKVGYTKFLPYCEAEKLNIPTIEQYEELIKYCKITSYISQTGNGMSLLGRNGRHISYAYNGRIIGREYEPYSPARIGFWLKGDSEDDSNQRKISDIRDIKNFSPVNEFMGCKLPVILVK